MPKKGDSLPFRVRYAWENGVSGSKALRTQDDATDYALELYKRSKQNGIPIKVTIEQR